MIGARRAECCLMGSAGSVHDRTAGERLVAHRLHAVRHGHRGVPVQVTVPFTATVSTAGLEVPLLSLRKKMSPNVTDAVAGACVVPPPVPPPVPGPVGLLLSPLQPASRLVASRPPTAESSRDAWSLLPERIQPRSSLPERRLGLHVVDPPIGEFVGFVLLPRKGGPRAHALPLLVDGRPARPLLLLFGLAAIAWPGVTLTVLVLWIGAGFLVNGALVLGAAVVGRDVQGRGWLALDGLLEHRGRHPDLPLSGNHRAGAAVAGARRGLGHPERRAADRGGGAVPQGDPWRVDAGPRRRALGIVFGVLLIARPGGRAADAGAADRVVSGLYGALLIALGFRLPTDLSPISSGSHAAGMARR